MSNSYCITLTKTATVSGSTVFVPNILGTTPVLVACGNPTIKHLGTHLGDGVYEFGASTAIDDGRYWLYDYDGGNKINSFGGTNGRWIGDDNIEIYAQVGGNNFFTGANNFTGSATFHGVTAFIQNAPVSYIAPTVTDHLTRKDYVDAIGATSYATSSAYSASLASSITSLSQSINLNNYLHKSSSLQNVYSVSAFRSGVYNFGETTSAQACMTRTSTEALMNQLAANASASYQMSQNVRRLIPNGVAEVDRVYTSYSAILNSCSGSTSTNQITIEIEGEGTSASSIVMSKSGSTYVKDYTHIKGYGADVTLGIPGGGIASGEFEAGAIGRITVSDLTISNGGYSVTTEFKNIVFKNIRFNTTSPNNVTTFTDCQFEGGCYFESQEDNSFYFTNCKGNRVFSNYLCTVSGTNYLNIDYPSSITLKTIKLTDNSGTLKIYSGLNTSGSLSFNNLGTLTQTPVSSSMSSFTEAYGVVASGSVLARPEKWLQVTNEGDTYFIPMYKKV